MATDEFAGPVGLVVFAFPEGATVGPGFTDLLAQVDAGAIEVLDLEVVGIQADGSIVRRPLAEVSGDDLSVFDGAETDLLDADDLAEIASDLQPGEFAIAVVYEDRSLARTARAWAAAGGYELITGGVHIEDLAQALDEEVN